MVIASFWHSGIEKCFLHLFSSLTRFSLFFLQYFFQLYTFVYILFWIPHGFFSFLLLSAYSLISLIRAHLSKYLTKLLSNSDVFVVSFFNHFLFSQLNFNFSTCTYIFPRHFYQVPHRKCWTIILPLSCLSSIPKGKAFVSVWILYIDISLSPSFLSVIFSTIYFIHLFYIDSKKLLRYLYSNRVL